MYLNPGLKKSVRRWMVVVFVVTVGLSSIFAEGVKKKIQFARGASSATERGAVVRGDQDRYYLSANQGQTMSVKITSLEDNAVFQVFLPGETKSLPGAGDGDDATDWSGELPRDAEYVIVVGGTRGNASYTLKVSIE